jgi:uncharacterized protein YxeA
MIWLKSILMIIGAFAVLTYFLPVQREQVVASAKHVLKLDAITPVNSKITVYQSQGKKGETSFSDRHDGGTKTHSRIVDNAKGTTFHADVPKTEVKTSSVLNFSQDNAKFQQQAQKIQHAKMEHVINDE